MKLGFNLLCLRLEAAFHLHPARSTVGLGIQAGVCTIPGGPRIRIRIPLHITRAFRDYAYVRVLLATL